MRYVLPMKDMATYASFEGYKKYVGFDDRDIKQLKRLKAVLADDIPEIIDTFYSVLMQDERAKRVFLDEAQLVRQKSSLTEWFVSALSGPYDEPYFRSREQIGVVHVRVGLPQEFMLLGMNTIRNTAFEVLINKAEPEEIQKLMSSLNKILDIDLTVMVGTFARQHENIALKDFRSIIFDHLPLSVILLDRELNVLETQLSPWPIFSSDGEQNTLKSVFSAEFIEAHDHFGHLAKVLEGDSQIILEDVVDYHHAGERYVYKLTAVPLRHPDAAILLHIEELTNVVQQEERIQNIRKLAQLGTMAATVAHEIRNPIAGIANTLQVIESGMSDDDRYKAVLGKVQKEVFRLGDLVGELLSFSRPIKLKISKHSLRRIADGAAHDAKRDLPEELEINVSGDAVVGIDADWLHRILLNMIQNSAQANATRIDVEIEGTMLTIHDNGDGVPETSVSKIFDAFYTTKTRGTGLGLATVRKAIEAMGGDIRYCPEYESGAHFQIRFN